MSALGARQLDLAVLIDCTASMFGEIAAAQGGLDEMLVFSKDLVSSARLAIVGYRDRRDEFETKAWDFTSDVDAARRQLWMLNAEGGGDVPEAVHPALKLALTQLTWRPESTKVLILVGDAPPHVGYGQLCVNLAKQARDDSQVITHTIQAEGKDVEFFDEIAKAGGGRCVSIDDDDLLIAEITGLTLGERFQEEFREFFQVYLELCR
jgi:Mg-chelatase subunit ChlD